MHEQDENRTKRRYLWPWFVLMAFILFVVLTILWMSFAVKREKEQRNFNAPIETK